MIKTKRIFEINGFEFHYRHLLIILILCVSFSCSVLVRSQPAQYGFELDEVDPFFHYRATNFLVNNGLEKYFEWHDYNSWHPVGRNISDTSPVGLHITAAYLYKVFGVGLSLYEFVVLFPVVFGSLTCIVIFALVRKIAGTTSGLFASLFFSVSPLIIARGNIGWFKSEPLGLFLGLLSLYLLFSALNPKNSNIVILKLIGAGFFLAFGISSWGGTMFFVIPLAVYIIALPFVRKDNSFLIWSIPLFVGVTIATGFLIRPGLNFSLGLGGLALIGPTIFLIILTLIQKISRGATKNRNSLIFLIVFISMAITFVFLDVIPVPESERYLRAVNPLFEVKSPIFSTVTEHAIPQTSVTLFAFSILLPFAGFGIWLIFKQKIEKSNLMNTVINNEMLIFILAFGIIGVYVGANLSRLLVFSSLSVIMLSSIGLALLTSLILKKSKRIHRVYYGTVLIFLLILPTFAPAEGNWLMVSKQPPSILRGNSLLQTPLDDWKNTMDWIRTNTPNDAVVVAWWDYGYWITTLSDRKTISDAATFPDPPHIEKTAELFLSSPEKAIEILDEFDADYVLISWTGHKLEKKEGDEHYRLVTGGDLPKTKGIIQVAQQDENKFLVNGKNPNFNFWKNTLLGKMIPFKPVTFYQIEGDREMDSEIYTYKILYKKIIEYNSTSTGPLKLVYSSPSFDRTDAGPILAVLVYEINKDYSSSG